MQEHNLRSKGFVSFIVTQFLGVFNDNGFKILISLYILNCFTSTKDRNLYIAIAFGVFIIPFIFFSTYAGWVGDRFSKKRVMVWAKCVEILVMALGMFAFWTGDIHAILLVLFFMGTQSAFFSPSKYGILPEILPAESLSEANGILEMTTFVAIIIGTAIGGPLKAIFQGQLHFACILFILIAIAGVVASLSITQVEPSAPQKRLQMNFAKAAWKVFSKIRGNKPLLLSLMAVAYFWFLGAIFQQNLLLYASDVLAVGDIKTGYLLTVTALGIGVGSLLAARLSHRKIELGLVPLGAIGIGIFGSCLFFTGQSYPWTLVSLFWLGIFSGCYIVPLHAYIQYRSPHGSRGEILGLSNIMSFSAILVSAAAMYVLVSIVGLRPTVVFGLMGIGSFAVTVYICSVVPEFLLRLVVWILVHTIYKVRIVGEENIPTRGGALLVCNHVSYIDPFLLIASSTRHIRFLMEREIYNVSLFKPFCKIMRAIPISTKDAPKEIVRSLKAAQEALAEGHVVCIFAEGQITRLGTILEFSEGFERISRHIDVPVIPVHLDRVWGSIFSYAKKKFFFKIPRMIPYPITVSFGCAMPPTSNAFSVRQAVSLLGAEAFHYRREDQLPLHDRFLKQAKRHPFSFCMADSSGLRLNNFQVLVGALSLSKVIQSRGMWDECVGILLPSSVPGALVNLAVMYAGKVPVNLNYTMSWDLVREMSDRCNSRAIITSRKVVEGLGWETVEDMVFLEDLKQDIARVCPWWKKGMWALVPGFLLRYLVSRKHRRNLTDTATIVFSSGSTGVPKGVVLSHQNIVSNIEGFYQIFQFGHRDVLLGILPFFHSFGFTAALWIPLVTRTSVVFHHNPLDGKMIGTLVKKYRIAVMLSTPTFLQAYIKRCRVEQFASLKTVIVGAEKLNEQIRLRFMEKFNIEPFEGYGTTELSPVVSLNVPDFVKDGLRQIGKKPGRIGRPIPGVSVKVVDPDTHEERAPGEEGLLLVKGPNVMQGYLDDPQRTASVMVDGWYITGDIAHLDKEGFITIVDRYSRFSKIGGEMVPHIKIENAIKQAIPSDEVNCVVTSVPDAQKGEAIVVLYTGNLDVGTTLASMRDQDLPNLWIPRKEHFIQLESIPILGSGKIDLRKIRELAKELVGEMV